MRFGRSRCPTCGELARGIWEQVPGLALLRFEQDEARYTGETTMAWDDQAPCRDAEGQGVLECPGGHH
jgi:hypothetical protein